MKAKVITDSANKNSPIFLFSSGRSGSTWLQRILNIHQDITIWGEHYGFLQPLAESYKKIMPTDRKNIKNTPEDARAFHQEELIGPLKKPQLGIEWVNAFSKQDLHKAYKTTLLELFTKPLDDTIRWGFKEILYQKEEVFIFLDELFPRSQFIFLKRNPVHICSSTIYAFIGEEKWLKKNDAEQQQILLNTLRKIERQFALFSILSETYSHKSHTLNYEALRDDFDEALEQLADFLDVAITDFDAQMLGAIKQAKLAVMKKDISLQQKIEQLIKQRVDEFSTLNDLL